MERSGCMQFFLLAKNVGEGEFTFVETDGNKAKAEKNTVLGLRKIRSFDKDRQSEKISFDKKTALAEKSGLIFKAEKAFQDTLEGLDIASFKGVSTSGGVTALGKFKEQLLLLLNDNKDRYSEDNVQRIRMVLTTTNIAFENKLRSYLRKFDNQITIELLDALSFFSIDFIRESTPPTPPDPTLWFGYYGKEK